MNPFFPNWPLLPILMLAGSLMAQKPQAQTPTQPLTLGGEDFYAEVYLRLAADTRDNIVFSPWSLRAALAMTRAGARGETAAELDRVLRLPRGQSDLGRLFAKIEEDINRRIKSDVRGKFGFASSNRIWPDQSEVLLETYLETLRRDWNAPAVSLDFRANCEAARKKINAEVAVATRQIIKELLKKGIIDPATRLVLTNALWLKSPWQHPFQKPARPAPFFGTAGEIRTAMMSDTRSIRFGETEEVQVAAIPLEGKGLEFVIMLPRDRKGLAALESKLNGDQLRAYLKLLEGKARPVRVSLPRFKTDSNASVRELMEAMGLKNSFSPGADFSGISAQGGLFVSDVIHGASIDVNEAGLEAAAATAVIFKRSAAARPTNVPELCCDHPFAWMVRDRESGSILFAGRLVKPVVTSKKSAKSRR